MRVPFRRLAAVLLLVSFACVLPSCAWSIGESDETVKTTHPTLGVELQDLRRAHEDGCISDEEYEQARQKLLASADQRGG